MIGPASVLLHTRPLMLLYVLLIVPIAGISRRAQAIAPATAPAKPTLGKCVCRRGFTGEDCGSVDYACPHNCAGHGYCDGIKCVCDEGYHGRDCGKALNYACPSNCAGRGTCIFGQCACNPGFTGAACDVPTFSNGCAHNCSGGGWCGGGSCVCAAGLGGAACEKVTNPTKRGCPHGCTGHGQCKCSSTAPGSLCACQCDPGWSGPVASASTSNASAVPMAVRAMASACVVNVSATHSSRVRTARGSSPPKSVWMDAADAASADPGRNPPARYRACD